MNVVTELHTDLFNCPPESSLAHCVSQDLKMGKGIAVEFRERFGRVDELEKQKKKVKLCNIFKLDHYLGGSGCYFNRQSSICLLSYNKRSILGKTYLLYA